MSTAADQIIAELRVENDYLAGVVAGLSESDLRRRSGAVDWTIAQVLSHLGSGAVIALAALQAALTGQDDRGEGFNQLVWDRWNAMSPTEQAAEYLVANEALVTRYDAIDADARASCRIDLGFPPAPVDLATAAGLRLNEFTLHLWDVDVIFDVNATLAPSAAGLLGGPLALLFGSVGHADASEARGVIAVETTDPTQSFGFTIADSVFLGETPTAADSVLQLPTEAWIRLVTGRLSPEHTPAAVQITGGSINLADLRLVFPGF